MIQVIKIKILINLYSLMKEILLYRKMMILLLLNLMDKLALLLILRVKVNNLLQNVLDLILEKQRKNLLKLFLKMVEPYNLIHLFKLIMKNHGIQLKHGEAYKYHKMTKMYIYHVIKLLNSLNLLVNSEIL